MHSRFRRLETHDLKNRIISPSVQIIPVVQSSHQIRVWMSHARLVAPLQLFEIITFTSLLEPLQKRPIKAGATLSAGSR